MNEAQPVPANETLRAGAALADGAPDAAAEARYLSVLDALVADACEGRHVHVLADSLAWTVARVCAGCGMAAAGDLLRRIGGYVTSIEARRAAAIEAEQAKQAGRLVN